MVTIHSTSSGDLRTISTHLKSDTQVYTDAPVDNHGKGSTFSPTDLLCTSLATCMMTIMGIAANTHGILLPKIEVDISKVMASDPRRIAEIILNFRVIGSFTEKDKKILESAAHSCPVGRSLHPDLKQSIDFSYLSA